jgi:hypothetical protein
MFRLESWHGHTWSNDIAGSFPLSPRQPILSLCWNWLGINNILLTIIELWILLTYLTGMQNTDTSVIKTLWLEAEMSVASIINGKKCDLLDMWLLFWRGWVYSVTWVVRAIRVIMTSCLICGCWIYDSHTLCPFESHCQTQCQLPLESYAPHPSWAATAAITYLDLRAAYRYWKSWQGSNRW